MTGESITLGERLHQSIWKFVTREKSIQVADDLNSDEAPGSVLEHAYEQAWRRQWGTTAALIVSGFVTVTLLLSIPAFFHRPEAGSELFRKICIEVIDQRTALNLEMALGIFLPVIIAAVLNIQGDRSGFRAPRPRSVPGEAQHDGVQLVLFLCLMILAGLGVFAALPVRTGPGTYEWNQLEALLGVLAALISGIFATLNTPTVSRLRRGMNSTNRRASSLQMQLEVDPPPKSFTSGTRASCPFRRRALHLLGALTLSIIPGTAVIALGSIHLHNGLELLSLLGLTLLLGIGSGVNSYVWILACSLQRAKRRIPTGGWDAAGLFFFGLILTFSYFLVTLSISLEEDSGWLPFLLLALLVIQANQIVITSRCRLSRILGQILVFADLERTVEQQKSLSSMLAELELESHASQPPAHNESV